MKIVVDRQACEGNSRCVEVAPELFEVRDDDKAIVKMENPPAALQEKIKLAIKLCPRQAIRVED
jgi:ferredoxin